MTADSKPDAALSILPRADGSAIYSHGGYTVTASVNGPIEAQRRDEHPYEAHVDVIVRPVAGVGGTRERHLESLLESSISELILVQNFPRGLIQIVLQIENTPENLYVNTKLVQANINISILPTLFQAAVLALLSAAIPMRETATAALVAVVRQTGGAGKTIISPSTKDIDGASSVHALAFTSQDDLLLAESEGYFTMTEWDNVFATAKKFCCGSTTETVTERLLHYEVESGLNMQQFLRVTTASKVSADLHWKSMTAAWKVDEPLPL